MATLTTNQVWDEIEKQLFAVMGMVTANNEARTAGIVYIVNQRKLYISSLESAWKTRHVAQNPHVSLTVTIAKRIWFLPWIKIPAATITFSGTAKVLEPQEVSAEIIKALFKGMEITAENSPPYRIIEITPEKEFITYGMGVSLMDMRDPAKARGRVSVN